MSSSEEQAHYMGIFNLMNLAQKADQLGRLDYDVASPFSERHLSRIVVENLSGVTPKEKAVTREEAMTVPSIAKARALIIGTLARQPLALFDENGVIADTPRWLYRSDTTQAPLTRMTWTLDDLIFYGRSLWYVDRDENGLILDAIRIPIGWWNFDSVGQVVMAVEGENSYTVPPPQCIVFEGLQEGILEIGARSIRGAINLEKTWQDRVASPVPLVELHESQRDTEITDDEASALVTAWESARQKSGATAFTPYGVDLKVHGETGTNLFIEGRNAIRLDVANFTNLPSSLLEGSQSTATLTYSTAEGRRNELVDYSLAFWAGPIEARLSLDDITPPGTRIGFDLEYLARPETPSTFPTSKD